MRDTLRRYRARRAALTHGSPGQPPGPVARHLTTRAALSSGIVGRKRTPRPQSARQVPDGPQAESRGNRVARGARNDRSPAAVYGVP
jgi:hypothetical protein